MADRQLIRPLDVPALRAQYARAEPFPYFVIEAPAAHSTIFRARPDERRRGYVLMPAGRLQRQVLSTLQTAKRRVRRLIGRASGRR
jgi:hypothetical protein